MNTVLTLTRLYQTERDTFSCYVNNARNYIGSLTVVPYFNDEDYPSNSETGNYLSYFVVFRKTVENYRYFLVNRIFSKVERCTMEIIKKRNTPARRAPFTY